MIPVGDDADGNANALRDNELGTRAVDGVDQPSPEFPGIFKGQGSQPRRRARLVKGVNRFDRYRSSVGQKKQLADRFPSGKQERPFVKIDLDFEFRFQLRNNSRRGIDRHGFHVRPRCRMSEIVEFWASQGNIWFGQAAPVAPPAAGKIGKTDAGRLWRSSWLAGLDSCSVAGVVQGAG